MSKVKPKEVSFSPLYLWFQSVSKRPWTVPSFMDVVHSDVLLSEQNWALRRITKKLAGKVPTNPPCLKGTLHQVVCFFHMI